VIGQISVEFARDTADVTDRQNVQLHWIRIEDVPEIWRRLEASGCKPPRPAATARGSSSALRSRALPPRRSSTPHPPFVTSLSVTSATRSTPTCPGSSRPPSPVIRCTMSRRK
jgi:sulfite reductase (ferredoxin)